MSLQNIQNKIIKTCKNTKRDTQNINLIAVSKQQSVEKIKTILDTGHRFFGENRIQEVEEKWPDLHAEYSDISLHFIGHLQTNKVKIAVQLCDAIHSIDSERIAESIKNEMEKQNKHLSCFVQINTGAEEQKTGISPQDFERFFQFCTALDLKIQGLMCIPPAEELPDPHFALLHKLAAQFNIPCLSMGMSSDFESAIRFGATHLRVGRAIFTAPPP